MWNFYVALLRQIPRTLVSAAEIAGAILALIFSLLALVNRPLEQVLALRWEGVSSWWAMLPIILVFAYMVAKANYEAFLEIGGIPDPPAIRTRFYTLFHERAIPAYQAARQLLVRFYGLERLYAEGAGTDSVTHFAIIEPADVAFEKVSEALESHTYPIQFVAGEFLVTYQRMVRYIDATLEQEITRTVGVTRQDPQVANWQRLHDAFRAEAKALLNDPRFSTMRKIVRGGHG